MKLADEFKVFAMKGKTGVCSPSSCSFQGGTIVNRNPRSPKKIA